MILASFADPDKPEPKAEAKAKGVSRKAAKDAKEIYKSWFLKPKDIEPKMTKLKEENEDIIHGWRAGKKEISAVPCRHFSHPSSA